MTSARQKAQARGHNTLMLALRDRITAGDPVPCIDAANPARWTSDDEQDLEAAALACTTCSALVACCNYIAQHDEDMGTWAGLTPDDRIQRKAQP